MSRRTDLKDLTDLGESLASLGKSLAKIAEHVPHAVPWPQFLEEILPEFSPPFVTSHRSNDVRRVIREIEAIDLADEGQAPRHIMTTFDLNSTLIGRFLASRPPESPFTTKCRLMTIKTLVNRALGRRYLIISPFADRPIRQLIRTGRPRNKGILTMDEIRRLFELLRGDVARKRGWPQWKARRLLTAFAIAIYGGLRRRELFTLHVEDIDLDARVIRLEPRGERGMGLKSEGSAKPVGMPLALVPILADWLEHRLDAAAGYPIDPACPWMVPNCSRKGPWLTGRIDNRPLGCLQAAARRAGIPKINWQMCRRSLASHMDVFGASQAQIQRQLRHSNSEVTETFYRQADERNVAEFVREISFE
jgi:integrase